MSRVGGCVGFFQQPAPPRRSTRRGGGRQLSGPRKPAAPRQSSNMAADRIKGRGGWQYFPAGDVPGAEPCLRLGPHIRHRPR